MALLDPLADYNPSVTSGATLPKTYPVTFGTLAVGTHRFEFKPRQAGRIVGFSGNAQFPNTLTADFEIAGTDNIAAPESLTTGTTTVLDAADFSATEYAAGEELTVEVVVATGAATCGTLYLFCEEEQGTAGNE